LLKQKQEADELKQKKEQPVTPTMSVPTTMKSLAPDQEVGNQSLEGSVPTELSGQGTLALSNSSSSSSSSSISSPFQNFTFEMGQPALFSWGGDGEESGEQKQAKETTKEASNPFSTGTDNKDMSPKKSFSRDVAKLQSGEFFF